MPNYKELYLKMFRASEKAVNILLEAQRECEELFISQPEPELTLLRRSDEGKMSDVDTSTPAACDIHYK